MIVETVNSAGQTVSCYYCCEQCKMFKTIDDPIEGLFRHIIVLWHYKLVNGVLKIVLHKLYDLHIINECPAFATKYLNDG